jgi:hypothetical protein
VSTVDYASTVGTNESRWLPGSLGSSLALTILVLVAGLENVIEQLEQSTRKEVQVSSGNGSSVNRADLSALKEIKGAFPKEY